MEKITENKQEFPGPHFQGEYKKHKLKNNFEVSWWNADVHSTTIQPGIYIRMFKPDRHIKEEKFFPFGQEDKADEEYQKMVKKIDEWDKIGR